ncbi:MAG: hypothetical protein FWG28_07160 [Clostridiales bacterium]|nr:hypothetical protein [Clostridiales bacterium]
MARFFNTAGLMIPEINYCIDPLTRVDIYQEIIPWELTWVAQTRIPNQESAWYVTPEHRLDMPKLLGAFQQFFREHSDAWVEGFDYKEAGPQLLLQAFLQRIVNGGGHINREYGLGRLVALYDIITTGRAGSAVIIQI